MKSDVFVSYSNHDWKVVEQLCVELQTRGVQLWIDRRHRAEGVPWRVDVRSAIAASRCVLLAVSPCWQKSPHCEYEVDCAITAGKPLVALAVSMALTETALRSLLPNTDVRVIHSDSRARTKELLAGHLAGLGAARRY
jgi:hypothetical protein